MEMNQGGGFNSIPIQHIDTGTVKHMEEQLNQGSDSGEAEGNNSGGDQNNAGQNFDINKFWKGPEGDDKSGSQQAPDGQNQHPSGQQAQNPVEELNNRISEMDFGGFEATEALSQTMADGDMSEFNKQLNGMLQKTVKNAILTIAPMLKDLETRAEQKIESHVNDKLLQNSSRNTLRTEILSSVPQDKVEFVEPFAEAIFTQSMKHTGNNEAKAVTMAKEMLSNMVSGLAGSANLNVAPKNSGEQSSGNRGDRLTENEDWLSVAKQLTVG